MKYYIYDPFTQNHIFLVNSLKLNIEYFNYNVDIIKNIDTKENNEDYYIILINHLFLIKNENAKIDYKNLFNKKKKILYITEPLELMIEIKYYYQIIKELKPNKIFTYCEENLKKIKTYIPFYNFYPINYRYLQFIQPNLNLLKKKNFKKIVFIGVMNDYRNQLKKIFGEDLIIIEDKYKKEEWIKIINEYQYFVNVHRRPNSKCFESLRIIPLLYNKCTVISEHVNEKEELFYKNKGIYFCEMKEMASKFEEIKQLQFEDLINKENETKNSNMEKFFN